MIFNSLHFLFFFTIITTTYFLIPQKYRWFLLLAGSCYFYMAFIPVYILIMAFTIVIDYFAGIFIETSSGRKRKLFLIASIFANISILAIFKYYNFINQNVTMLLHYIGVENPIRLMSILLPLGLSFHTFKAMSYTIEVYRGNQKAERNFGIYALYSMFFPLLVAGPIERPQNLLHQFYEKHYFDYERVVDGLKVMAWGLFKKVVIADRLAIVVDHVYNNPHEHAGLSLIIATIFFSFQIFCDFSGYSDIAIGAGKVMGFRLAENFNRPYHSRSLSEFWKRWHISLSTWFKDYLYISLGGNRVAVPRWYFNLFFVFLVSGLWHGANWTFIAWGALHGFYVIFALMTQNIRLAFTRLTGLNEYPMLRNMIQMLTTYFLVTFAWIFFRANSVSDAFYIIQHSVSGLAENFYNLFHNLPLNLNLGVTSTELTIGIGAIILMEGIHLIQYKHKIGDWVKTQPIYLRWGIYYASLFMILFLGVYENRQFIYFQF